MNHKLQSIIDNFELPLDDDQHKHVIASVGINDLRKNPTPEQEDHLNQVFQLIKDGQSIDQAIAQFMQQDNLEPSSLSDADLERIITEQAIKAADAALLTLPNIAEVEFNKLRQTFVQQFRKRVEQQLQSPEYRQNFLNQIQCLGESLTLSGNTPNTALLSSSSTNS